MITPPTTLRLTRRTTLRLTGSAGLAALIGQPHLRTVTAQPSTPAASEPVVVVGDVEDFALEPEGRWEGGFGSVTLRMHAGSFDGGDAWFIRTDASDQAFAQEHGLVYVPKLGNALDAEEAFGHIYPSMVATPSNGRC